MICGWLTLWMWYPMDMEGWLRDSSTHRFWYLQGYLGRTSAPWILKDMCTKNSVNWTTETYPLTVLEVQFNSVQLLSPVWLFETPWTTACQASLSITNSQSPPKTMSIESAIPSNHLILCHPLLLLPSIFPASGSFQMSQLFTSGGQSIGVSASTSVLPMRETRVWTWYRSERSESNESGEEVHSRREMTTP